MLLLSLGKFSLLSVMKKCNNYFLTGDPNRFSHLTLLGMRIVAIFRTICGRRETWGSWRLPTGQLTFEFTIKVLRQERGEVSGSGGPVVEGSVVPHNDITRGGSV